MSPTSWLEIEPDSPFSLANIPFGIISTSTNPKPRPAVAIGDWALDLEMFARNGGFRELSALSPNLDVFSQPTLNLFAALGQTAHGQTRKYLQDIFAQKGPYPALLEDNLSLRKTALVNLDSVKNHMPMHVGDYTDFYAGRNHAYNVGVLFRGKDNALQPNYEHIPVGYHGRASSIVVSGTKIRRPHGQILPPGDKTPVFSACKKLDIELEMGAFICKENTMGTAIPIAEAKEYIFGAVLLNDWSARDIQAWEYVPLGPFLSKNFGTTLSPWIVLAETLAPFLDTGLAPGDRETLLPYLRETSKNIYNIELSVDLETKTGQKYRLANTNAKNLLFSYAQMLAHHSVSGCNMRVGDLLGSGTISGTDPGSYGSFLEQTHNGKTPIKIGGGEERSFLEDGDKVTIRGFCGEEGSYVGFGECVGTIV